MLNTHRDVVKSNGLQQTLVRTVCQGLLVCLALFPLMGAGAEPAVNRFNVLLIAIDDLRPQLGCYGVAEAQSPELDKFASEGLLFTRHYVQVATCGASRYALLTGRSPARSGVTGGNAAFYSGSSAIDRRQLPEAQSMPELFRRSGYRTVGIGKVSHTADGLVFDYDGSGDGRPEVPHAWDEMFAPYGPWQRGWGIFFAYAGGRHREDGRGHRDLMEFTVDRDEDLPDGLLAAAAVRKLKDLADDGRPFFMSVGFFKPHLPFVAPRQDWEAFNDVEISLPPAGKIDSPYWHRSNEFYKYDAPFEKSQPLSPSAQRQARRAYMACVRYVDRQVGKVLQTLQEQGLADNTIVVIWGDHGWHLGEQQIWAKHTPFERATRSVLMMRVPGITAGGGRTNALVESLDIYPTLIDLCQPQFQQTRYPLDGKSLSPLLRGEATSIRDAALSYWRDAVSVRDDRHRLVVRMNNGEATHTELYDVSSDLDSTQNLANQQPRIVADMLGYLP